MKVDLTAVIYNLDGAPLKEKDGVEAMLPDGTVVLFAAGTKVKNSDGETVELIDDSKDMTLGFVFKSAMINSVAEDKEESEDEKYDRWQKAKFFSDNMENNEAEIAMKDVTKIWTRVKKLYKSPVIYGNVRDLTDPEKEIQSEE